MSKTVLLCTLFAGLGAVGAIALTQWPATTHVAAQVPGERSAEPGDHVVATEQTAQRSDPDHPMARPVVERDDFTPEERVNIRVYEDVNRGVVNITTRVRREDNFNSFFFNPPTESSGSGSGAVLDRQGHILTNFHVIEGAREIQVTLYTGKSYAARRVGEDATTDIAVLKIDAPKDSLFPVRLGISSRLKVGQRIFAIGNPFGLERTLTTGIISSLNRTIPSRNRRTIKSIIQIDADINPGNSGGPLVDTRGRLIGMNTAIATKTGQSSGVGFAIPVGTIARVVPQLIEKGRVIRPEIGITRVMETEHGLLIAALAEGGPAQRAGLQGFKIIRVRRQVGPFIEEYHRIDRSAADLVVAINGQKFSSVEAFLTLVEKHKPGDTVTLTVIRKGRHIDVPVRLAAG